MGKKRGPPRPGDLADMTVPPPPDPPGYLLPDPDECEEVQDRIVLTAGHELYIRYRTWKDRLIVEFAIGQIVRHNGQWVEVARIDTCHGTVHKHQLRKAKPDDRVGKREELQKVPTENGWTVVDQWYGPALALLQTGWTDNLRRWRRDRT